MTEQEQLLSFLADKKRQAENDYVVTHTGFLSEAEQSTALSFCRREAASYLRYGGYPDAERALFFFLPDYRTPELFSAELASSCEEQPLAVLRCHAALGVGARPLTHRDYLGALLALGIRRDTVGDILVFDDGADILILAGMADYLLTHFDKAGRTALSCEILSVSALRVPEKRTEEIRDSVASERLDNLVSAAFSVSRADAAEAIAHGLVFVNGIEAQKTDARLSVGDTLVFRGHGKAVFEEISGTSRKGRLLVVFRRFL